MYVWAVRTTAPSSVIARFAATLAPDQIERAQRFRFEPLRHKYVLAAGALRFLIGRYLRIEPAAVTFVYGPRGKPALAGDDPALHFNMSHSGELAVFAFIAGTAVGIDIEKIRPLDDMLSIASHYFCAAESNTLRSLGPEQSRTAFFNCWTRKEAYLKATGNGLYTPLDEIEVTMLPHEKVRFVHIDGDTTVAQQWTLHDLQIHPGYAAAVAYRSHARFVHISGVLDPENLIDD